MSLKLKNGRSKYLLRRVLERRVPRSILDRGKQRLRRADRRVAARSARADGAELLLDGRLRDRGIFEPREVARLWNEHRDRPADHRHRLWQLVMLELWFRQFVDERPPAAIRDGVAASRVVQRAPHRRVRPPP